MPTLPAELLPLIVEFQPFFSKPVWEHAQTLLIGALLAMGKRTVAACLRSVGKSDEPHFQNYHRLLNRARWSALALSRVLLHLLVKTFAPTGALLFGLDDTSERRRGEKIKARGLYRDPVRSAKSHTVKARGLGWWCGMLLIELPWAAAIWAWPFRTVRCPSERYYQTRGRTAQKLTERAWQMLQLVAQWLPQRPLVFVADSSFAALTLLKLVSGLPTVSLITRLRLDAALYDPAPPRQPPQQGRPRRKGKRRPTLAQALADPQTSWAKLASADWYGAGKPAVEVCSAPAVW